MDGLVQHGSLLGGCLEGGKEDLRIIMASACLTGSYRPGSSKRDKAAGDLDVNLARDSCDARVKSGGERNCTVDHRSGRHVWVTGQGKQNISDSHRTLRRNVGPSFCVAGQFDLSHNAGV
jgi:hypothetical protein